MVDGLSLETDVKKFAMGAFVRVGLVVAKRSFHIDAEVTEFDPGEHIKIEGESHVGNAALWLDLAAGDQDGTDIGYGLRICHGWTTRMAEPMVARHLRETMPHFAALYRQNVIVKLTDLRAAS